MFVGTKLLQTQEKEGNTIMTTFAEFAATTPRSSGYSFAKSPDKETLAAFGIPFWIEQAIQKETSFINEKTG